MTYANYMEELVVDMLNDVVIKSNKNICCDKCRKDIISIALNNLPPMYYSSKETYQKVQAMDTQLKASVTTELIKALELVEKNPRHD